MKKILSILGALVVLYFIKDPLIYMIKKKNADYYMAYKVYMAKNVHEEECYKARIKKEICELYGNILSMEAYVDGLKLYSETPYDINETNMEINRLNALVNEEFGAILRNTPKERIIKEINKDKVLCYKMARGFYKEIDKSEFKCDKAAHNMSETSGLMDDIQFLIFLKENKR